MPIGDQRRRGPGRADDHTAGQLGIRDSSRNGEGASRRHAGDFHDHDDGGAGSSDRPRDGDGERFGEIGDVPNRAIRELDPGSSKGGNTFALAE